MTNPLRYLIECVNHISFTDTSQVGEDIVGFHPEYCGKTEFGDTEYHEVRVYPSSYDERFKAAFADVKNPLYTNRPLGSLFLAVYWPSQNDNFDSLNEILENELLAHSVPRWDLAYFAPGHDEDWGADENPKFLLRFRNTQEGIILTEDYTDYPISPLSINEIMQKNLGPNRIQKEFDPFEEDKIQDLRAGMTYQEVIIIVLYQFLQSSVDVLGGEYDTVGFSEVFFQIQNEQNNPSEN